MKKSLLLLFIMLLAISCLLAACGAPPVPEPEDSQEQAEGTPESENTMEPDKTNWPKTVNISTASSTGSWYYVGGAMCTLMEDYMGIKGVPQASAGAAENARLVGTGDSQIGMVTSETLTIAYNGEGIFNGEKYDNLRAVYALFPLDMMVITLPDSTINSFADIMGKKVGVGPAGSGTQIMAEMICNSLGYSFNDFNAMNLSFTELREGLADGTVDAIFYAATNPVSGLMENDSTTGLKFVAFSEEELSTIMTAYPAFIATTVPGGTYSSVPDDYNTVGGSTVLVVDKDADVDFIYNLTKNLDQHMAEYSDVHATISMISNETALDAIPIPMHEGAYKYFEETSHPKLNNVSK